MIGPQAYRAIEALEARVDALEAVLRESPAVVETLGADPTGTKKPDTERASETHAAPMAAAPAPAPTPTRPEEPTRVAPWKEPTPLPCDWCGDVMRDIGPAYGSMRVARCDNPKCAHERQYVPASPDGPEAERLLRYGWATDEMCGGPCLSLNDKGGLVRYEDVAALLRSRPPMPRLSADDIEAMWASTGTNAQEMADFLNARLGLPSANSDNDSVEAR